MKSSTQWSSFTEEINPFSEQIVTINKGCGVLACLVPLPNLHYAKLSCSRAQTVDGDSASVNIND